MQIEEVFKERECQLEMLNEMRVDLINTAKTIVQQLEQDPMSATDHPFNGYYLRSIDRFAHAAKIQPQDAGNAVGSVEGQEGTPRSGRHCHGFGKECFIMKSHEQYCVLRTETNYEHLSQFVIPNWGTQSAF